MTTENTLSINSCHIRHNTIAFLDARIINNNIPAISVTPDGKTGWSIVVDKTKFGETLCTDIPADLGSLIVFAIEHTIPSDDGKITIFINKSVPVIQYLPRYKYLAHNDFGEPGLECCYQGPALLYCKVLNEFTQLSATRKDG